MQVQAIASWLKKILGFIHQASKTQHVTAKKMNLTSQWDYKLTYSEQLIDELEHDHEELMAMYSTVQTLVENQKFEAAIQQLLNFREAFNQHLIEENKRLYPYFDNQFSEYSHEHLMIKSYRKDMQQIAYIVVKFFKKWTTQEVLDKNNVVLFLDEYKTIAGALTQRMSDEENELYRLYCPA